VLNKAALWVYLTFFSLLIAAGLGFPMPEELPIVTAGAMVGHASEDPDQYDFVAQLTPAFAYAPGAPFPANLPVGLALSSQAEAPPPPPTVPLRWYIMLPVLIIGVVISDGLLYGMGRLFGPRLLEFRILKRLIPPERRIRIEGNFHKYGILVLLFARFMPTIRSPIFIMAGVMRLSFVRFVMADGLYAIPGVSLLFFLAYWFGNQFRDLIVGLEGKVSKAKPILIMAGIAAVAAYLIYHFLRHPVATGDPREELPVIGDKVAAKMSCPDNEPPRLEQGDWKCPDGSTPTLTVEGPDNGSATPADSAKAKGA
jgi:membrane protein DedA with SNARE-associated domain